MLSFFNYFVKNIKKLNYERECVFRVAHKYLQKRWFLPQKKGKLFNLSLAFSCVICQYMEFSISGIFIYSLGNVCQTIRIDGVNLKGYFWFFIRFFYILLYWCVFRLIFSSFYSHLFSLLRMIKLMSRTGKLWRFWPLNALYRLRSLYF